MWAAMAHTRPLLAALALHVAASTRLGAPPRRPEKPGQQKVVPFSRIADEIHGAEVAAEELERKVKESTAEKSDVQWYLATAMKELTNMKKVVMNNTVPGTLGYKYQKCLNSTGRVEFPTWNQSLTLSEAIDQDDGLAPSMVEHRMFEVFDSQQKVQDLTMQLGECSARCQASASLLARTRKTDRAGAKKEDPAPAPAAGDAGGAAGFPPARELMRSVAEAIYNTSHEVSEMRVHLKKDQAAKSVLENLSAVVTEKVLMAKKAVEQMKKDLEWCVHRPKATHLNDAVTEAMADNPEMSKEIVDAAADQASDVKSQVDDLQAKLDACNQRC